MKSLVCWFSALSLSVVSSFVYSSDQLSIRVAPNSHHLSSNGDPNEENNLVAIEYNRWAFATFVNSHSERSWAFGYYVFDFNRQLSERWYWDAGIPIGIASGYDSDKTSNVDGLTPFASASTGVGYQINNDLNFGVNLSLLPTDNGGVLVPEGRFKFRF